MYCSVFQFVKNIPKSSKILFQEKVTSCENCSKYLKQSSPNKSRGDEAATEEERMRELELELAQTKLAHVEAECRNQVN